VSPSDLLASVSECFKASKSMLDKILVQIDNAIDIKFLPVTKQEATNLVKVCVTNSIFLHKLTEQVGSGQKVKSQISFDFQSSSEFCCIKIT
jgi:hypothetical protein